MASNWEEIVWHAVTEGKVEQVRELLAKHPEAASYQRPRDSRSLLMQAACCESLELVELLLNAGADLNHSDVAGSKVLHYAWNSPKVAERLVQAGADLEAKDNRGGTPYCSANSSVREVLLRYGASTEPMRIMSGRVLSDAICMNGALLDAWLDGGSLCVLFSHVQLLLRGERKQLLVRLENVESSPPVSEVPKCWLRRGVLEIELNPEPSFALQGWGKVHGRCLRLFDVVGEFSEDDIEERSRGWWEAYQSGELGDDPAAQVTILGGQA